MRACIRSITFVHALILGKKQFVIGYSPTNRRFCEEHRSKPRPDHHQWGYPKL